MWIVKKMSLRKKIYRYITPKKLSEEFDKIKDNENDYLLVFGGRDLRALGRIDFIELPDLKKKDVDH